MECHRDKYNRSNIIKYVYGYTGTKLINQKRSDWRDRWATFVPDRESTIRFVKFSLFAECGRHFLIMAAVGQREAPPMCYGCVTLTAHFFILVVQPWWFVLSWFVFRQMAWPEWPSTKLSNSVVTYVQQPKPVFRSSGMVHYYHSLGSKDLHPFISFPTPRQNFEQVGLFYNLWKLVTSHPTS